MSNSALEKLIWVLIYGGLLVLCTSFFVARSDSSLGWTLGLGGSFSTFTGAVLIWLRSRRDDAGQV